MVPFLLAAVASDGSVTFDSNAPASTDFWIGPQRYGAAKVFGTEDAVAGTDTRANGLRYTSEGVLRVYDATSAVPAGATTLGGFAVTSDGQLCVTTDAVSSATFVGGIAVRSDGAVFATGLSTPRSIADAVISALTPASWYRNATGVTSAGGFASQWDDYSGNARHLVQATGTNQPAYAAGVFTFDGADNCMDTSYAMSQPVSVYLVFNQIGWAATDSVLGNVTGASVFVWARGVSPRLDLWAGSGDVCQNTGFAIGAYKIMSAVLNGASSILRCNDNADATGNPGAGTFVGGFRLAAAGGAVGTWAANIAVKECVIFEAAHDDTTRDSVVTALNDLFTVF